MSLIPQLNRYETCLMCGDPVPMGMPCPSCKAGEPLPAAQVVVRPSSMTAPDMTTLVAMLAEAEQRGREAEREACAKVAHAYMISQGFYDCHRQSEAIAAAIRARANLPDVAKEGE